MQTYAKMVQDCAFAWKSEFQFGVRRKNEYNPGSAGSEFGEKTGITLVRQVRSSEKGLGRILVWQVWSSEKDTFLSPNSEEKKKRKKNEKKGRKKR